jgi:dihydrofolate synthase/folylpolyglutamate synthase
VTYSDAIQFLSGIQVFGQQLGLETMSALLERLGNPHNGLRFLHIAGTNGKGSVAAMSQAALTAAGYRTGLYTSPHLVSFCERIQINSQLIPETEVAALVEEIKPLLVTTPRHPTLFEVVTAMALLHFQRRGADVVVWETGLGGRLDATNVVTPLVSVITNIGFDHTQYLGDTLAKIAAEKAGIIKPGIPVVTAAEGEPLEVIRRVCAERHSLLTVVTGGVNRTPLLGSHQAVNCAVAEAGLRASGLKITDEQMQTGLARTRWPGRFEIVRQQPLTVLDGAHNPQGAEALAATLREQFNGRKLTLILGVLRDKDYSAVCRILAPLAARILCVPVASERTTTAEEIAFVCRPAAAEVCRDVAEAYAKAAGADVVVITGSLFLIGEAMARLQGSTASEQERKLQ